MSYSLSRLFPRYISTKLKTMPPYGFSLRSKANLQILWRTYHTKKNNVECFLRLVLPIRPCDTCAWRALLEASLTALATCSSAGMIPRTVADSAALRAFLGRTPSHWCPVRAAFPSTWLQLFDNCPVSNTVIYRMESVVVWNVIRRVGCVRSSSEALQQIAGCP